MQRAIDEILKRLVDIILSSLGLIVLLPLFVFIAVKIKSDSDGPIFYIGKRIGRFGKPFGIYKFRTMVANADTLPGGPSSPDDDPRVTTFGRFLRKSKLNELPQLLNVLRGEMSLVGPRPEVEMYVDMYTDEEQSILSVSPGITDWASIANPDQGAILAGSADPDRVYMETIRPEKLRLQLEYVRTRSFWLDLKILFKTLETLIRRRPA